MSKYRVLVIGDIIIDKYTFVKTERFAQEAHIPVWDEVRTEYRLGGASNVANNIKSIGGNDVDVYLAGIVGSNNEETHMIKNCEINTDMCVGSTTMFKHRYVDSESLKYLLRCDNIKKFANDEVDFFRMLLTHYIWERQFDAIVISDYDKGTITEDIVKLIKNIRISIVDSKRKDIRLFCGSTVLKVNEHEYSLQVSNKDYNNFERFFDYVVVTKGANGSELRQSDVAKSDKQKYIVHTEKFPTEQVNVTDVTGCGDTHTAAMTMSLLRNDDIRSAIKFANICASKVVKKFGTSTI